MYADGDVFVFPEKFNGLSLPLQEAYASGMLVMTSHRFPMNTWLPTDPMIPVDHYERDRVAVDIESAVIDPKEIAETMDRWYSRSIEEFSIKGRDWARENSWEVLGPKYLDILGGL
jgi:glycosyltransferase involved in cell wall biosynthesis